MRTLAATLSILACFACASATTSGSPSASVDPQCAADTAVYPEYQVQIKPVRLEGSPPPETSPYIAQIVIDATGRPEPARFRLIDPARQHAVVSDSSLIRAAWVEISPARWSPGRIGKCAKRVLIQEPAQGV